MIRALSAFAILASLAAPVGAAPRDAILAGDMPALTREIEAIWKGHGLSWPDWIEWRIGSYTTVYWYYDTSEDDVIVGDMPKPDEIEDYWKVWSKALTDGNFDPASFFTSPQEALELARYNQFVLGTHETAHVMTYRYDYDHRERHNHEVNCREYYADRLTAAILQDQAGRDPDMARWRLRYLDLVRAMHATIPEQYLVTQASYADLEADCAVIRVDQPTPDKLQAYASAYFTRHAALLSTRLPPLKEMLEKHLERYRIEKASLFPPASDLQRFRVETLGEAGPVEEGLATIDSARESRVYNAYGFGPDGALYQATLTFDTPGSLVALAFGPQGGTLEPLATPSPWSRQPQRLELESLAVFEPDLFFVTTHESGDTISIIRCERIDGKWQVEVVAEEENTGVGRVFRTASGRLALALSRSPDPATGEMDETWRVGAFDPRSMGEPLLKVHLPVRGSGPVGIDEAGRLYFSGQRQIVRIEQTPAITHIFGSGLHGHDDGGPDVGQITDVMLAQAMPDGTMLLLDRRPDDYGAARIRRLVPFE